MNRAARLLVPPFHPRLAPKERARTWGTGQRTINGVTNNLGYQYYLNGLMGSLFYPSGHVHWFEATAAGRIFGVIDELYNYVFGNARFTPNGDLSSMWMGGSMPGYLTYNKRLQPALSYMLGPAPSHTPIYSYCYDFHVGGGGNFGDNNFACTLPNNTSGDNGNAYQIINNLDNNRTQNFTYDSLNRIQQAYSSGPNWGETITIDAWGNLTNKGPITGKTLTENFNAAPATVANRLTGYSYDAAGNLTNDGLHTYTYDAENRIAQVDGAWTYTYDGDGKRVKKVNGSTGTLYWTGTGSDAVSESDLAGNIAGEYVFFNGQRVARVDRPSNAVHYYFSDRLGTARVIADANGNIQQQSDYFPYGGEIVINAGDPNRYKFTGKERDPETGFDNFGARYFGSSVGRFMSPDAFYKDSHVADPQSWNEYAYARNNPLRYVDPNGENATVTVNCYRDNQDHTTCNVSISASISIYAVSGSNISQEQLTQAAGTIQSSIQNAWSGSFTQDGVRYNVSTQVSVSVASSQDAAMSSGAQNVIGMTNGLPQAGAGAFVNPKSLWGALTGAPDTGMMDINHADNYAKHEFTHLLGVDDKSGMVISNTNPPMRPNSATSQDYGWGIREATQGVNSWVNAPQYRPMHYGEFWEKPAGYSDRTTVGAPYIWWK